jgi:hypothetical protein
MKIRIKGNSIRLRVTQGEVETFGETGYVSEITQVSNESRFIYELYTAQDVDQFSATFFDHVMRISVPFKKATKWASTDQVGMDAVLKNGVDDGLSILIEKDFQCLVPREHEDESDNYPNPLAKQ